GYRKVRPWLTSSIERPGARAEEFHLVHIGPGVQGVKNGGEAVGPFGGTGLRHNEILADFYERMSEAVCGAVAVHGVAAQCSVIRLVVAHDDARFCGQCLKQRARSPVIAVP